MRLWSDERLTKWTSRKFGAENSDDEMYIPHKAKEEEKIDDTFKSELKQKIAQCLGMIQNRTSSYESLTESKPRIGTILPVRPDIYSVAFIY